MLQWRGLMNEARFQKQLQEEGFETLYIWEDGPDTYYSEHRHQGDSAHIILDGEMALAMDGDTRTYRPGDRVDVPAGRAHTAKMGPKGCRYLIGEKRTESTGDRAVEQLDDVQNLLTRTMQSRSRA